MNLPTNKSFGFTFGIVFFLIFLYFLINFDSLTLNLSLISVSCIFFVLGLINSKILYPLNFIWFRFGIFLGKIVSPLILIIIYFFVVTPTGFIMKILRKDLLALKFNDKSSYWIIKKDPKSKMKNQF